MDFEKMVNSKFYTITDWLYKLFLLNAYGFLLNVFGLIIFAFMPAIIAIYLVVNELIHGKDFPLLKTYFKAFKKVYFRSQKLFVVYLITSGILYLNFKVYSENPSPDLFYQVGILVTLFLGVLAIISLIHLLPLFIYFPTVPIHKLILASIKVAIAYPITTILLILAIIPTTILSFLLPPAAAFICISFPAYLQLVIVKPKYALFKKDSEMLSIEI